MAYFPARQTLMVIVILLTGCDGNTHDTLCQQHPDLCRDLVDDSRCRNERSAVIRSRFSLQAEPTDQHKYQLMRHLEGYLVCIEHASNLEYKRDREQKSPRVEGMLAAQEQLARMDLATRHSDDPYLLLWHWTTHASAQARQRFLAQEGSAALEEPELQLVLAGSYAKRDPVKAIAILHHALTLYRAGDRINSRLLTSLSALYMGQKQYGQAYLWAKVSESFQDPPEFFAQQFDTRYSLNEAELQRYEEQARAIISQLREGRYR